MNCYSQVVYNALIFLLHHCVLATDKKDSTAVNFGSGKFLKKNYVKMTIHFENLFFLKIVVQTLGENERKIYEYTA